MLLRTDIPVKQGEIKEEIQILISVALLYRDQPICVINSINKQAKDFLRESTQLHDVKMTEVSW